MGSSNNFDLWRKPKMHSPKNFWTVSHYLSKSSFAHTACANLAFLLKLNKGTPTSWNVPNPSHFHISMSLPSALVSHLNSWLCVRLQSDLSWKWLSLEECWGFMDQNATIVNLQITKLSGWALLLHQSLCRGMVMIITHMLELSHIYSTLLSSHKKWSNF